MLRKEIDSIKSLKNDQIIYKLNDDLKIKDNELKK
jgi:hypothetical protein